MNKKHILFIINPHSGLGKHKQVVSLIEKHLDHKKFHFTIQVTKKPGHANSIVKQNLKKFSIFCAVGGDGTVNEVGCALIGTKKLLAIIPTGSGNGYATYLKIPTNTKKAIQTINRLKTKAVDTGYANNKPFLAFCGIGLDAIVAQDFSLGKLRGFFSYAYFFLKRFFQYRAKTYTLSFNRKKREIQAFWIFIANTGQYAKNIYLAPKARIDDGKLDVVIIKLFKFYKIVKIALRTVTKQLDKSRYIETYQTKHLQIEAKDMPFHLDGEPQKNTSKLEINIKSNSLNIIL